MHPIPAWNMYATWELRDSETTRFRQDDIRLVRYSLEAAIPKHADLNVTRAIDATPLLTSINPH